MEITSLNKSKDLCDHIESLGPVIDIFLQFCEHNAPVTSYIKLKWKLDERSSVIEVNALKKDISVYSRNDKDKGTSRVSI